MPYDREPRYAHPFIAHAMREVVLDAIQAKLPSGYRCRLVSAYRTPEDQIALFKKGRTFRNGRWAITNRSEVVTFKDGYVNRSRHNYLPCTAVDISIFDGANKYQSAPALYKHVKEGKRFGFDWGGDWTGFADTPHLEIPYTRFFQRNIEKDNGFIWQQYLLQAGTYTGVMDGLFGPKSITALQAATGEEERNRKAWDLLWERWGGLAVVE
jgi:peptidoglycan LD-endopeptidase CwlK